MKILLPLLNGEEKYIEDTQTIVLIGANGSGKTRMSIWIDENNPEINVHRISAQKSLNIPESINQTNLEQAEEKLIYGTNNTNKAYLKTNGKIHFRWGDEPETHLLNDFQQLMEYLMSEYSEKSIEYRQKHLEGNDIFDNETKLEIIKAIWEDVVPYRKLEIYSGKIEAYDVECGDSSHGYNASKMSDGERAIFYFIGEVLCAEQNSLIIIDEPENHLHKSVIVRLWDAIENARADCTFLYITHDLDFASSRLNSQIIWVKNMHDGPAWEYELLGDEHFPNALKLEILGSRQKVLLVEGTKEQSIDRKLYSKIYPEYNIIPLEGCNSIIQATKAYNKVDELNYVDVKGIIDRDRRSDEEINKLAQNNIFVPEVAEIENLFLLPEVIALVAKKQEKDNIEDIVKAVKEKTIVFLSEHIDEQALLFARKKLGNMVMQIVDQKVKTVNELDVCVSDIQQRININDMYNEERERLQEIINKSDFDEALRIINNKGLLPYTGLPNEFGWKKRDYIDYVIRITGVQDEVGSQLRTIFKEHIGIL